MYSSPEIIKGLVVLNFRKPSKIQERALPLLTANPPTNLIAQSQSGTGKTAAFVLNLLKRIDLSTQMPQAVVLAPTRELARQTIGVIQAMGQFLQNLTVTAVIPDPTKKGMKYEGQILVGTPGSMMDMLRRKSINASQVKILVLDEADNMLNEQGMGDQCKRVKQSLPRDIQTVLFSATFPEHVIKYADQFAPNANKITLRHDELNVPEIKQLFIDCEGEADRYGTLLKLYGMMTIASSIIFVRTRQTALELEQRMVNEGHTVAQLTGALQPSERDAIIDKFRSGEAKVLIATNVLARGIDVQSVTMVINYDVPVLPNGEPDYETYLHRIGRTGRFGRVGVAISFIHDKKSWENMKLITDKYGIAPESLPRDDWDAVEDIIKKVIKSSRAGKSTKEMQAT
jgi:ATP-dependent RNA helicase DDX19/DBP5